jgi:uridine kinase
MNSTLDQIVETIKKIKKQRVLIAIEGFGGAGKTTFADTLAKYLRDAYVVHMDDFIVKERIEEVSWDNGVFDRERLKNQVLEPLKHGREVRFQKLLWEAEMLSDAVEIPNVRYVIVEGISSYHPDIATYYDIKIWIHAPIEVAGARGQKRDQGNENKLKWGIWANNDRIYQEKYHPERQADFVVDNIRQNEG